MSALNEQLPIIHYVPTEQVQQLVLMQTLLQAGVEDPQAFLDANDIVCRVAYWPGVGMGVTISQVTPKAKVEK